MYIMVEAKGKKANETLLNFKCVKLKKMRMITCRKPSPTVNIFILID